MFSNGRIVPIHPFPPATAAAASLPPAAPARPEGRGPRGRRPPSELGVTPGPAGGREVFGFFQGAPVSCENAKLVSEKNSNFTIVFVGEYICL